MTMRNKVINKILENVFGDFYVALEEGTLPINAPDDLLELAEEDEDRYEGAVKDWLNTLSDSDLLNVYSELKDVGDACD